MIEVCMIEDMTSAKFFDTTGKRIRILREDRELNQTELARRMAELGVGADPSYPPLPLPYRPGVAGFLFPKIGMTIGHFDA